MFCEVQLHLIFVSIVVLSQLSVSGGQEQIVWLWYKSSLEWASPFILFNRFIKGR